MSVISIKNASFSYDNVDENNITAINDVNIDIEDGEFVSILGRNGSGKSTLAKLFNALLLPKEGIVLVYDYDTMDSSFTWEIRKSVGMVFQNPDNQIIGTTVEEDIAFGPENIGIPTNEIRNRVDKSLKMVGLDGFEKRAPHMLSGGQKQRTAIAGILAVKPKIIVLDEATSMLDPIGREEVMKIVTSLNEDENITIINITHHMDETVNSDKIIVLDKGKVCRTGDAKEVFSDVELIKSFGLEVPQITSLFNELIKEGIKLPNDVIDLDEALEIIEGVIVENWN